MFSRLTEIRKQWRIAWSQIAEASSIKQIYSKNNDRRSMIVVVMILVIMSVTGFELVKTYKNNTEEIIKQFRKLLQLQMCVSFNDEFTKDRNSSDNYGFEDWMIVDERIFTLETEMKDFKGQIGSTYGVIAEQDNVKTRSACQKLVSQNADEECVQCSEDARREERMK